MLQHKIGKRHRHGVKFVNGADADNALTTSLFLVNVWRCQARTSLSDLPFGLKSQPPLPPPIGSVVRLFFRICSEAEVSQSGCSPVLAWLVACRPCLSSCNDTWNLQDHHSLLRISTSGNLETACRAVQNAANLCEKGLRACSKPRNLMMDSVTEGWNRRPPLYGPSALLNCTLYPRFTCGRTGTLSYIAWASHARVMRKHMFCYRAMPAKVPIHCDAQPNFTHRCGL